MEKKKIFSKLWSND